jgi:hypothetical protein
LLAPLNDSLTLFSQGGGRRARDAAEAQLERELEAMLQGAEADQEEAEELEALGEAAASAAVGKGRPLPFVKKTKTVKVRCFSRLENPSLALLSSSVAAASTCFSHSLLSVSLASRQDPVTKKHYEVLEILINEQSVKKEIEKRRRVRSRAPKSVEEMAAEAEVVRKKRRIRENIRRLKNDTENLDRVIDAIDDHDTDRMFEEAKLVCGACGMPGHMRTNKICPKNMESSKVCVCVWLFAFSLLTLLVADERPARAAGRAHGAAGAVGAARV